MICPECGAKARNRGKTDVYPEETAAFVQRRYSCACGYTFETREEWVPHTEAWTIVQD